MKYKEDCPLCKALKKEKDKYLYEDENIVILPTKNMKGHNKRIMVLIKHHRMFTSNESEYLKVFIEFCKKYFDEEPTFALCEPTYASVRGHWHRIACDWHGTDKEIKQLHYTPHQSIKTKVEWKP